MASQADQMDWEPTVPISTLLPQQVLTLQRELLVARAGRKRTMGLTYPTTSVDHRPPPPRRVLEKGSPKRQWAHILSGVDIRFRDAALKNGTATGPSLPLVVDSPPITPRKRVIEEVEEPEQYEDRFSDQNGQKASLSAPKVVDSPQDISMIDVFTPPHQPQQSAQALDNLREVEEATSLLGSIGLRSPEGTREKRPNWFELRNGKGDDEMEDLIPGASLRFGSLGHGATDFNSLLSQIPGSWPASPPRPVAAPVDLPVQPSPEVKDAPPSPDSRARDFMMVGGIESTGPEESRVVPRPTDVPMTYLQSESLLHQAVGGLRSLYELPKYFKDCWGKWAVQRSVTVASNVKRRALSIWTSQTSQTATLPAVTSHSPRRTEPRRERKLPSLSMEQRRELRLKEKRMKRKKTESQVVYELQTTTPAKLHVLELKPVSVPSAAPTSARLAQRGVSRRHRSKPAKSSIEKIMPHKPGSSITPGRVTKQRTVRPVRDTSGGLRIVYKGGVRPDASFEERRRRVEQLNLDFVLKSRPAQVILPEPQQPESPVAPVTSELSETSEPPPPASASVPSTSPGPCTTAKPSIPEGVTPVDPSRRDESYDGYTLRPAGPRTRRVHWHEASGAPLGQPVVEIRVYDPSAPVRPAAGAEDSQQPAHATIDDKSPEGPFIKPISSKWDSRLTADMSLPDYRQVGTTISGDPLTRKDFATCYTPLAWLNDEVINAYLAIILDYARRASGSSGRLREPKYHAFNSFFYSSLRDRGYESVRRWASRARIGGQALLGVEMVLIPIHNQAHWTLMVVKPKARSIEYFDSLSGASRAHISRVKEWLQGELRDLFVEEEWRVLPTDSPQQDNGSDCGVFLLTTAKMVVLGLPLSYGARDIPMIRKRIVAEILNGGFEGDFDPKVEFPARPRL
ncbi:hypothetical protein MGYG_04878 [Nannizzia gypsea CBS 118893]|uniref:Ubiquitin-like protease family profile domain-containing protein n=1 Tax=Arthroderma gypseum (strain ATCC MYA-4604 / CBS 118893) TaxID=535722 RepID=E4UXD1_ARTGP|nr:hypothetical protein MGYG_04878 [Nannizzia gypsea CBS 118893]EFR01879.1 hypothetical protein MGYG_04878 [Nannizzia gypsea CBS 118893]